MKALITGITGFAGSHLAEYLLEHQPHVEVAGTRRWRSPIDNITGILGKVELVECDLRDSQSVLSTLEQVRPDYIFHLAAQSFVPTSWDAPASTLHTNVIGQIRQRPGQERGVGRTAELIVDDAYRCLAAEQTEDRLHEARPG
ncbi:MAG: GDP-mannose 4,6-dehydratase, partial [Holophagales bacterium]|nr:GDP-mannose 4,6-dehydratase [Holophagales bacterium]